MFQGWNKKQITATLLQLIRWGECLPVLGASPHVSSKIVGSCPNIGRMAIAGFTTACWSAGAGAIIIPPVSENMQLAIEQNAKKIVHFYSMQSVLRTLGSSSVNCCETSEYFRPPRIADFIVRINTTIHKSCRSAQNSSTVFQYRTEPYSRFAANQICKGWLHQNKMQWKKKCMNVPVCHQVSTNVHLPLPTTSWYHSQASWLIGSPTKQSNLSSISAQAEILKYGHTVVAVSLWNWPISAFLSGHWLVHFFTWPSSDPAEQRRLSDNTLSDDAPDPRTRNDDRSYFLGQSSPYLQRQMLWQIQCNHLM